MKGVMKGTILPILWLLLLLFSGLPQFSETAYTPSFPSIGRDLNTNIPLAEYTLTIYLFGLAAGMLLWNKLSHYIGRKICIIIGFVIFILGCAGCYLSSSIYMLMISRFIQGCGGSVGNIMGQVISKNAFHGQALGKVYAIIGAALTTSPAIGPIFGGFIIQYYNVHNIYLLLIIYGVIVVIITIFYLPKIYNKKSKKSSAIKKVFLHLIKDKKVIGYAVIIGSCNGIFFSYFSEGSFFFIELLDLSQIHYGLSFLAVALSTFLGGMLSIKLHQDHISETIMRYGLRIILFGVTFFSFCILSSKFIAMPLIAITIISQMIISLGICIALTNALATALVDYKWCSGTASSIFGFSYYFLTSMLTFGMALLYNGTLLPMPLYFVGLSIFINIVDRFMIQPKVKQEKLEIN